MNIYSLSGRRVFLKNHNKMLWRDRRSVIGKTGWTRSARHCFVGRIQAGRRRVVVAVMGSHALWRDLKTLVDYEFGMSFFRPKQLTKPMSAAERRRQVQLALKHAGYYKGLVDGSFGKQTARSLKKFQRAKSLTADGRVGSQTWQKLQAYL